MLHKWFSTCFSSRHNNHEKKFGGTNTSNFFVKRLGKRDLFQKLQTKSSYFLQKSTTSGTLGRSSQHTGWETKSYTMPYKSFWIWLFMCENSFMCDHFLTNKLFISFLKVYITTLYHRLIFVQEIVVFKITHSLL